MHRRTPLYEEHRKQGARFVPFGGWEMPVQYSGVVEEHNCVRTRVGLFDVSHMGEIFVFGPKALKSLQWLLSNDVSRLTPGRAQYSVLTNEQGGAVDDVIVYQLQQEEYLLCVNASNREKDFEWMRRNNRYEAKIEDLSDSYVQIAVQGPRALDLIERVIGEKHGLEKPFTQRFVNSELLVARTGYTGEDGAELYTRGDGAKLWRELLEKGQDLGVLPIGLGARDTLRLEAGYCLYGHELRDEWDILSCGLGWVTKFDKGEFVGRDALLRIKEQGPSHKLVGLELLEPGIAREETEVFLDGRKIGVVTSGTKTPTLNKSVAIALLEANTPENSNPVCVVRGREIKTKLVRLPFYKRG
jgi:aminomethyltransferase